MTIKLNSKRPQDPAPTAFEDLEIGQVFVHDLKCDYENDLSYCWMKTNAEGGKQSLGVGDGRLSSTGPETDCYPITLLVGVEKDD